MLSAFSTFQLTLVGDVTIFVVTLLFSTKIKDVLTGVPSEARTAADTLVTDVKTKIQNAKADVLAEVRAKFVAPVAQAPVVAAAPAPAPAPVVQPAPAPAVPAAH